MRAMLQLTVGAIALCCAGACSKERASDQAKADLYASTDNNAASALSLNQANGVEPSLIGSNASMPAGRSLPARGTGALYPASPPDNDVVPSPPPPPPKPKPKPKPDG